MTNFSHFPLTISLEVPNYTAVNNFYHPDTLGEFIEDINLKDPLIVNWASYKYYKPISGDTEVRFENISLSIHEDGYLITNILSTGKKFFAGEENTQAFVDYVLKECSGYEIVYTLNLDEIGIPE